MKKNILLSLIASSAVLLSLPYIVNSINRNNYSHAVEDSFSLVFDKDSNVLEDSVDVSSKDVLTSKGNKVTFSYKGASHPTRGITVWENIVKDGYFGNGTAITGISRIEYTLLDNGGGLYLYYGDEAITDSSERTYIYTNGYFDFENTYPSYFELRNEESVTASISSLKIYYTCQEESVTPTDKSLFNFSYDSEAGGYLVSIKDEYSNSISEITLPTDFLLHEFSEVPTPVIGIADGGFEYCKGLTYVHIPSSYTHIGNNAFRGCEVLKSITIPEGVNSISENAFKDCGDLENVCLPDSIETIGISAFASCSSLRKINLLDGITTIDMFAFDSCTNLDVTHFPETLLTLSYCSFRNCKSLTKVNLGRDFNLYDWHSLEGCNSIESIVVDSNNLNFDSRNSCNALIETISNKIILGCMSTIIPDTVEVISEAAFMDAEGLRSISFPESVKTIEAEAFRNCSSLTSIYIPKSVTKIGNPENFGANNNPFMGCSSLEEIIVDEDNPNYNLKGEENCIVNSKNELISACSNTVIPSNVHTLLDASFAGLSITELEIPSTVSVLKNSMFLGCKQLKKMVIPNSVSTIGYSCFVDCVSLESVFFPTSIASLGAETFRGCDDVVLYTPYESMPNEWKESLIGVKVVYDWLGDPITHDTLTYARHNSGYSIFKYTGEDTTLVIPSEEDSQTIFRIDEEAFKDCTSLVKVIIPDVIETIESKAFANCTNLYDLVIGEDVSYIATDAFDGCSKIIGHSDGVFYKGNSASWANIENASTVFAGQNIYFYSSEEPTSHKENYWHYDTDGITILFWR